tara:strand:+ start:6168 stop:7832 length:1665 start_codon:yes stop_codon:yes gene_type:complete
MPTKKHKILLCNEASFLFSGYGKYGKEVMSRLYDTGKYELAEFATYGRTNDPRDRGIPWTYYANAPSEKDPRLQEYNNNPSNQFGEWRFERVLLDFKPDIVFDIRDFWMLGYQSWSPLRDYYHWAIMPTVDSAPQRPDWIDVFASADGVFTYSDWSGNVLKKESGGAISPVGTASPGVDIEVFKPVANKSAHKEQSGLLGDIKIIGTVMRNQKRKLFPDLFQAFRKFLDQCEQQGKTELAKKTFLYLHTSYPDVGWDIPILLKEFGLGNKVLFTYLCKQTGQCFPSFFQGASMVSPFTKQHTAVFPSVVQGISEQQLRNIMCLFDVYVQYSICEGFGMPQVEAAACGVPVMSVDYSAMEDVVRNLNGQPIKVKRLFRELETGAYRAMPDNDDLAQSLLAFFSSPEPIRQRKGFKAREAAVNNYTWDHTAKAWENYFDSVELRKLQGQWNSSPRFVNEKAEVPENIMNHKDFVEIALQQILNGRMKTHQKSEMIRDLNYGARFTGKSWVPFSRENVLKTMKILANNINECEKVRCGLTSYGAPDFIQYAHARKSM